MPHPSHNRKYTQLTVEQVVRLEVIVYNGLMRVGRTPGNDDETLLNAVRELAAKALESEGRVYICLAHSLSRGTGVRKIGKEKEGK